MKQFKKWLINRFLPRYAYETLVVELEKTTKKMEELQRTIDRQQSYISGLEYALRCTRPTVVVEGREKEAKEKT